ncbi:MAG TPA: porin [Thiolapillus brandeum]|uniref:Porin n=1 Tax=Thiolapillus brandeum TaxID=1076588 RepID=A0A831KCB4_9GAMM|nr:porin [Thiolapillus brandeum]
MKKILGCAALLATSVAANNVHAANWLMLQGTEAGSSAPRAKVWGFIQPEFQSTKGTELAAGPWKGQDAAFNLIGPDLDSKNTFQIRRARLGVRGAGFGLDSGVNYFLLVEAGNNGITRLGGSGAVRVTDASVTLNYVPNARFRIGLFKTPGSEEGLMAIHVFNYINFTNMANQQLLERFLDEDGTRTGTDNDIANKPNGPIGAFRDIGIQVFDTFISGNWEHSYAAMIGNGNGISWSDNNSNKDYYLYWASELVFGDKKARRQGWKTFAWYNSGTRTLDYTYGTDKEQEFDRNRWGIGTTYLKGKWRAAAEFTWADGMIFNGSDGAAVAGSLNNAGTARASLNMLPDDKADGWYVDVGYKILPKLELDLRYDILHRGTDTDNGQRDFETWTIGAQWFFNKKARVIANYEFRSMEAPGLPSSATPNKIGDSMDDRLSVQILAIF